MAGSVNFHSVTDRQLAPAKIPLPGWSPAEEQGMANHACKNTHSRSKITLLVGENLCHVNYLMLSAQKRKNSDMASHD